MLNLLETKLRGASKQLGYSTSELKAISQLSTVVVIRRGALVDMEDYIGMFLNDGGKE